MHYSVEVVRDGRWWMVYVPEIDICTQTVRRNDVQRAARELIATVSGQDMATIVLCTWCTREGHKSHCRRSDDTNEFENPKS